MQNNPNNSPQNVTFNTNQLEVFDKLLDAVNIIENNEQIVESIEDMKNLYLFIFLMCMCFFCVINR